MQLPSQTQFLMQSPWLSGEDEEAAEPVAEDEAEAILDDEEESEEE